MVLSLFILSNVADAAVYRWLPHSGAPIASGVQSNWGSCGGPTLTSFKITLLTDSSSSGCSSGTLTTGTTDPSPMVEMYFNTAYSADTNVTGNWYYGRIDTGGSTTTTYKFYLIYVFPNGTKVTLPGSGSKTASGQSDQNHNVSLTWISGTVPRNAKLGMRITKSVSYNTRILYFGDTAGIGSVPSGYFSVTETTTGKTYNLSGYVTNKSSGFSIEGATVQTDTGLTTTTNFLGYYIFYGLLNNSYTISGSYTGYLSNSTITSISGSNKTNVNISLSPEPEYLLSGYVKEKDSAVISDATVMTLTDEEYLTTTTDVSGYYSFLLRNGTYIITANRAGYPYNSIIKTVSGEALSNSNISLSSILSVEKILVATNRYVVLDDPIRNAGRPAQTSENFALPYYSSWSQNRWNQNQTKITGYALLLDQKGNPVPDTNVTFILTNWNQTNSSTSPIVSSDSNGLANYTFDMDARNYYGNWNITASASGKSSASGFIYNWWGCNANGCFDHNSQSPGSEDQSKQNSPYTLGREAIISNSHHGTAQTNSDCVGCHRSYSGTGGGQSFTGQQIKTSDVHTTDTCVTCHNTSSVHGNDVMIKSCIDCHTRNDLSKKTTMTMEGSYLISNYSGSVAASGHNPNSTIPCIICHGPMHNISKPDKTQRMVRNNDTESGHCMTCHTTYTTHNASNITSGGVNCTLCHSDDIHVIQVIGQGGSYVTYDINNPGASGNCTGCHQNTTYFNTLKSQTKAGSYSGRDPMVIRNPQLHSDVYEAGSRYGNFWWTQNQDGSCKYCHGRQMHNPVALGRPSLFKGNNVVNSTIGSTSWCASCHYPDYQNYAAMVDTFTQDLEGVPPSIIIGSEYWVKGRDHSIDSSFNDSKCNECHNGSTSYTKITPFMHEVYVGGGGPDCLGCHNIGSTGSVKHVNNSAMKLSMHANLNNNAVNFYGISADNKKCWGCHQTGGNQPINASMGDRYTFPYTCFDCHQNDEKPYPDVNIASSVTNHIDEDTLITRIHTHNATCTTCHNNSVNLNIAEITDPRIISEKESVSHYGSITSLVESVGDPEGCVFCHLNNTNAAKWGKAHDPRSNQDQLHLVTTNNKCYICHIQGDTLPTSFHNESMYYAGNGKIIVAANRYIILDDDLATGAKAQSEAGFRIPLRVYSYQNYWYGKNTRINATAMFIDRYGAPQSGAVINFTIYWPNGTALITVNDTTNSYGLANFSYDMNDKNYYGNWKIRASSNGLGANTTFIYNWWGCAYNSGPCNEDHGGKNPGSSGTATANSPYLSGRDRLTSESDHSYASSLNCTACHQSYDGKPGGTNPTTSSDPNHLNKPSDVHRNITCTNSNCHGNKGQHDSNQRINSCFNAACHSRIDISRKQTLSSSNVDTALSIYSNNPSSFNATYHTPNSTVPCIICHGPMHSITKADTTQRFIKNNDTEYNNCISCHQEYVRHNNSVNCPVCHSDDIHSIKVVSKNATYITLNKYDPNPDRANCNNCHQNSSFLPALLSNQLVGNYTGRLSPIVKKPMNHSEDPLAGNLWTDEGYWINNDPISWCAYCHNNEVHAMSALGKVKLFKGDNVVNSTIGDFPDSNTTWCASCHWQGYRNDSTTYNDMLDVFAIYFVAVPPEITGNATYAPTGKPGYYNHVLASYTDQICKSCHSISLGSNAKMTEFTHNVREGQSGGVNCTSCHDIGGLAEHDVDIVNMNNSAHANLNNRSKYTGGNASNMKCWACHGTLNASGYANESDQPIGEHNMTVYKNPRKCQDCHTNLQSSSNFSAPQVVEHREDAPVISTNGTVCSLCHNNSLTTINENDGFGLSGIGNAQNATASHYLKDANINLMTTTNHSNDCRWCHILNNESTSWGTPFNPKNSSKYAHSDANIAQNSNCYDCHGSLTDSVKIHDSGITEGAGGAPNCISCHYIGSQYRNIDTSAANLSVHIGMNSINATLNGYAPIVGACWACHDSDGNVTSGHPDKKDTPKVCDDCHVSGGTYYSQSVGWGGLTVAEHFQGGTDLKAGNSISNIASCINCHENVSEMILVNNDADNGSFAGDGIRLNGGNKSYYHYGKDRSDLRISGSTNCYYCHQNSSTAFDIAMVNAAVNRSIYNHTDSSNPGKPVCTSGNCHDTGLIHATNLKKPTYSNNQCTGCHAALVGYVSDSHNGTDIVASMYCWNCHQDPNGSMYRSKAHGMMYPLSNGSYSRYTTKGMPANCTTCHVYNLINTSPYKATIIPSLNHSTDPYSGKKWNNYWDNNSKINACYYCHQRNVHKGQTTTPTLLGNISTIKGNNRYESTDLAKSRWCSACHYDDSTSNYQGNTLTPVPPEITDSSLIAGDGTLFYNHSGLSNFNDSNCRLCHDLTGSYLATSMNYSHNLENGLLGGVNCTSCHDIDGTAHRDVDITSMDSGVHANLNNRSQSTGGNITNRKCWACHGTLNANGYANESDQPIEEHNLTMFAKPRKCPDCHNNLQFSSNFSAPQIVEHQSGAPEVKTSVKCSVCHNNSLTAINEIDGFGVYGGDPQNASVSHYSTMTSLISTTDCLSCHKNYTNATRWGGAIDPANDTLAFPHSIAGSTKQDCYACHNNISTGNFHSADLTKPALSTVNCIDCHRTERTMSNKKIDAAVFATAVHKIRYCENCHSNATDTNMNTYSFSTDPARDCTLCHTGAGIDPAPIVVEHIDNGDDVNITATCVLCHSNSGMYNPNSGTNGTTTAISHYLKYVTNTGTIPYQHFGTIDTSNCLTCHYNATYSDNVSWGSPINISVTHDADRRRNCDTCHNDGSVSSVSTLNDVDFHNSSVGYGAIDDCITCHNRGQPIDNPTLYPAVNLSSFGNHKNVNETGGQNNLTNDDCTTCHYNFNYDIMNASGFTTPTYKCTECHTNGNFSAPMIKNHRTEGQNITTASYCTTCHNNSINRYTFSVNTSISVNSSVSHYGTTTSLVKPTVNQTELPRFGFFAQEEASAYNAPCNVCHNNYPLNKSYGNATTITYGHTSTGTCKQCHVNIDADNLHNGSLSMPVTTNCYICHTTYADRYGAPNLTGTNHESYSNTVCAQCGHQSDYPISKEFDVLADHNTNWNVAGKAPTTSQVYLNGSTSLTVTKGTPVTIRSNISDVSGGPSKVRGAEYFIGLPDPGLAKGIPMNAVDGVFNAVNGAQEPITATLDTSGMSPGTYTVHVRGMDIGKQWTFVPQTATLIVESNSYINISSNVPGSIVTINGSSKTTDSFGNYSWRISDGNHNVTVSNDPTHYSNTTYGIVVTLNNVTNHNVVLALKPIGTISGVVTVS